MSDEDAIRAAVALWMSASQAGDGATVLSLMTDDAVFMVPGQAPFGKEAFAAAAEGEGEGGPDAPRIEGTNEIVELRVLGEWAYTRNRIDMTMTMPGAKPVRRAGYTLTLWRKEADGRWRLARDANLLAAEH